MQNNFLKKNTEIHKSNFCNTLTKITRYRNRTLGIERICSDKTNPQIYSLTVKIYFWKKNVIWNKRDLLCWYIFFYIKNVNWKKTIIHFYLNTGDSFFSDNFFFLINEYVQCSTITWLKSVWRMRRTLLLFGSSNGLAQCKKKNDLHRSER